MEYLYVKQRVKDYETWFGLFDSHSEAQIVAGLVDREIYRDVENPDIIVCRFKISDLKAAKAFVSAPEAKQAQNDSGMIEKPEILFLTEI